MNHNNKIMTLRRLFSILGIIIDIAGIFAALYIMVNAGSLLVGAIMILSVLLFIRSLARTIG